MIKENLEKKVKKAIFEIKDDVKDILYVMGDVNMKLEHMIKKIKNYYFSDDKYYL